jgi:multidrug efflux pump subunit AcrA (membrane-fusion protein)
VAGRLVRQLVDEDDIVGPGTVLAEIEPAEGA